MKTASKRKPRARRKHTEPVMVLVNVAELGPRPTWDVVQGVFGALTEAQRSVLLHWMLFHLGGARAEHESDPLAPANFRDHHCGQAAAVNKLLAEARLLMKSQGDKCGEALRGYFKPGE